MPSERWHELERRFQAEYDKVHWYLRHDDLMAAAYHRGRMDMARAALEEYERRHA